MNRLFCFLNKLLTHNYCDNCGWTKDELFVTEFLMEGGIRKCLKCIKPIN